MRKASLPDMEEKNPSIDIEGYGCRLKYLAFWPNPKFPSSGSAHVATLEYRLSAMRSFASLNRARNSLGLNFLFQLLHIERLRRSPCHSCCFPHRSWRGLLAKISTDAYRGSKLADAFPVLCNSCVKENHVFINTLSVQGISLEASEDADWIHNCPEFTPEYWTFVGHSKPENFYRHCNYWRSHGESNPGFSLERAAS